MFKNLVKKCYLAGRPPFFILNTKKSIFPQLRENKHSFNSGTKINFQGGLRFNNYSIKTHPCKPECIPFSFADEISNLLNLLLVHGVPGDIRQVAELHVKGSKL